MHLGVPMVVTVKGEQLKMVMDKLDEVKLEILRLRAMLLPEKKLSPKEERALEEARKEGAEGTDLEDLIREMGGR